jgi:membrane protease YdiL (CAAX protease family)
MRNYSPRKAMLVSSLLFALIHLNPWQAFSGFILGMAMAWICIHTRSLYLCMYIHLCNNGLFVLLVKYQDHIPLPGFNTNYVIPVVFQPLWLDILGVVIMVVGIGLLKKGFGNRIVDPGVS